MKLSLKNIVITSAAALSLLGTTVKQGIAQQSPEKPVAAQIDSTKSQLSNEQISDSLRASAYRFLGENIEKLDAAGLDSLAQKTIAHSENIRDLSDQIQSCDDPLANIVRDYIGKGKLSSTEILNYWGESPQGADVRATFSTVTNDYSGRGDKINLTDALDWNTVSHVGFRTQDGYKKFDLSSESIEIAPGVNFVNENGKKYISLEPGAQSGDYSVFLERWDKEREESVNLTWNNFEVSQFPELVEIYDQNMRLEEENVGLATSLADKSEYLNSLRETMKEAERVLNDQTSYIKQQEEELGRWSVGPYLGGGVNADGTPRTQLGLTATMRNGNTLFMQYNLHGALKSEESFEEREAIPSDRPAAMQGEAVRQTDIRNVLEAYGVDAGVKMPITNNISLGAFGGFLRTNSEQTMTDTAYIERQGQDGPLELNKNVDTFNLLDKNTYLNVGGNVTFDLSPNVSLYTNVDWNKSKGLGAVGGIQVNLSNLFYGGRDK